MNKYEEPVVKLAQAEELNELGCDIPAKAAYMQERSDAGPVGAPECAYTTRDADRMASEATFRGNRSEWVHDAPTVGSVLRWFRKERGITIVPVPAVDNTFSVDGDLFVDYDEAMESCLVKSIARLKKASATSK